jgi:hypothetical protein
VDSIESVAYPGKVLDLNNSGAENGTPILCWGKNGSDGGQNQKWSFVEVAIQ